MWHEILKKPKKKYSKIKQGKNMETCYKKEKIIINNSMGNSKGK